MSVTFEIVVPGEPVGKGRPRFARVGKGVRTFTPDKTANFESRVALLASPVLPRFEPEAVLGAELLFVFARPPRLERKRDPDHQLPHIAKPDVDNAAKAALDGLKAHLRDEQVTTITARKVYAERGGQPRTEIRIWSIT